MRIHSFQENRPLIMLAPHRISVDPHQPRQSFDNDSLQSLADSIREKVTAEYLKVFPQLQGKYSVHICQSADGVKL